MTEEQLRMIDAVAQAGSFRAAAARIGRSQSAVSKSILALEAQLGFEVFSREQYRPMLTTRGRAFLDRARSLIDEIERLKGYGRELVEGHEPAFGIALHHLCPTEPILRALGHASRQFQNTRFDLSIEAGNGAFNRLKQGQTDLAISHQVNADPEIETCPLFDIKMVLVRAPGLLPDADATSVIPRLTALRLPQVVVRDASTANGNVPFPLLDGQGHRWLVNDFAAKKQIILAGLAWGRIPLHHAEAELARGTLIEMQIEGVSVTSPLCIKAMRRRDRSQGMVSQTFWQIVTGQV